MGCAGAWVYVLCALRGSEEWVGLRHCDDGQRAKVGRCLKEWEERGQGEGGADDGPGAWRKGNADSNGGKGYMGSLPPGLHEPPPVKDMLKRDYANSWPAVYLLRPEVIMKFWISDML